MTITETEQSSTDGRHRRAQASREAIVESLVSLYADGYVDPSAAEIAERAGVSERSLFNVMRITRMHAVRNDTVLRHVQSSRKESRKQIERLFAPECEQMTSEKVKTVLLTINALMSFEHVEQLRVDQGMPTSRIVSTLVSALSCLFVDASR